ncbi:hypothetical protein [Deinococcus arenicola]|uniref:Uncharacterized protein n=1 Tax=Deinococcus arenicola TaxID=2994950 RepID=A0ABU4DNM9_9DEIO|nr:hypothetical protein [Deinococcus sp. ZS9-10]MDV6374049.1 hypothetical protein [Deinococcus sp. ZS9-10]
MPAANYLRSICVIPVTPGADLHNPALWERVFDGWRSSPVRRADGGLTDHADAVIDLVIAHDRAEVRAGALVLVSWPQAGQSLPGLINTLDDGKFVVLRVFGIHLTEVQERTERLIERLLRERAFTFSAGTRVALALSVDGVRTDLTSGHIHMARGGAWSGFYQTNKYALIVMLVVFTLALAVMLLITPDRSYTPVAKFYDLSGRVLSAVLFNIVLLGSQFLFYLRHRDVIEWEKP